MRRLLTAVTFGLVFCVLLLILGSINWRRYYYLSRFGEVTSARITAKEPDNHRIVRYEFDVSRTTFEGLQGVGPQIDSLNIGQSIPVYFYPGNPDLNCYCEPTAKLSMETVTILLAAFVPAFIATALVHVLLRVLIK